MRIATSQTSARMSGEERRRQLIEVAIDLFSQHGFAGTTTKEIATAAGVTEAIIFRHFATKQDFYRAILDYKSTGTALEWLADAEQYMAANNDKALFRLLVSTIVRIYREDPKFERLLIHAALEGHEIAIMHHTQLAMPIGAKFKEYIARRQSEGAIRQCDPTMVLFAVAGIPQFYALQKYIHSCGEMPLTDEQVIDTFMVILMDGLRTDTETTRGL